MSGPWPWLATLALAAVLLVVLVWAYPSLSSSSREGEAAGSEAPLPSPGEDSGDGGQAPASRENTSTTPPSQTFSDDFQGAAAVWHIGETVGPWRVQYDGFGTIGPTGDGRLRLAPRAADDPERTHAAMVTSVPSFTGDVDLTVRAMTASQLRTGTPPNPWEVAWVAWHHQHDHRFYYAILRPNGWELGKVDNTKLDPDGPECLWPAYENCKYRGAQRFLATGATPTFGLGEWHDFRITQSGNAIVLWGNGQELTRYVDLENPYMDGQIGLYTEDAEVHFDAVSVRGTLDEQPAG